MLAAGKLPGDAKALGELAASLSKHLAGAKLRFGEVAGLGKAGRAASTRRSFRCSLA